MAVNQVIIGDEVKLDLTGDTVSENNLLAGVTAHNAAGEPIVGTMAASGGSSSGEQLTIENAVVIKQSDSAYILHNFTETKYIAGNKIGYAGADDSIIVNENVAVKNTVDKKAETTKYVFGAVSVTNNTSAVINDYDIEMEIVSVGTQNAVIKAVSSKTGISIVSNPVTTVDLSKSGLRLVWTAIYPPGILEKFPYGYVNAIVQMVYMSTAVQANNVATLYIGFSSEAEYNAAVGLTYEPNTLTTVTDSTEVTG